MYLLDFNKKELSKFDLDETPDDLKQIMQKYERDDVVKVSVFFRSNFSEKVKTYFEKRGYVGYLMNANARINDKKIPIEALNFLKEKYPLVGMNWEYRLNSLGVPDYLFFKSNNGVYSEALFVEVKRIKDGIRFDQVQFALNSPVDVKFAFE